LQKKGFLKEGCPGEEFARILLLGGLLQELRCERRSLWQYRQRGGPWQKKGFLSQLESPGCNPFRVKRKGKSTSKEEEERFGKIVSPHPYKNGTASSRRQHRQGQKTREVGTKKDISSALHGKGLTEKAGGGNRGVDKNR